METNHKGTIIKVVLGILLLLGALYYARILFSQETTLAIFILSGLGLGYIVTRSEVGMATGFMDFFINGNRKRLYGLLMLFGIGACVVAIIHFQTALSGAVPQYVSDGSQQTIPGTSAVSPINFGLILGTFLFGVGLSLNKGCGLGTLRNIGYGKMRHMWTLVFILIGTLLGQRLTYQLDYSAIHQYEVQLYLPLELGYIGTVLLILVVLSVIAFFARRYEKKHGPKDKINDITFPKLTPTKDNVSQPLLSSSLLTTLFVRRWSRLVSVILITILLTLFLLSTGEPFEVTSPLVYPAVWLSELIGVNQVHPAFGDVREALSSGLFNHPNTLFNLGIILGAAIYGLTSGRFNFVWEMKWKESGYFALSGLLMGSGAVLASGCIVGALYSGIVNLSLSGWVVFASMSLGMYVTVKIMKGRISTITKMAEEE
ncbi:YeeE/YedE thiosulfate transporter family protein [Alkalibacterium sp. MB6]|uniref:YeeE/YedE thiosulfate transporter family protein n=1 Tax=Alkalibacterium sp. MB6 TaxID=2081965 RepID=UPI001379B152|nr:YeeE/YedE thiosulfate transporter family protein [Alkalibacterium sp. MB6]